ncbi:MAG: glycosyl transferase family 2 [Nitrospinae bacterium RIFCSPLOWO2_12_39_16]|nr:MAG: glycosyl transferase family 2 [Nitrospinae bacterium RIFCSPLOWO2_12_39_16]
MNKNILAIVPAYNEEDSISGVIDDIKSHLPEADIVVINDASTDGTANAVRSKNGVRLIDLSINLGIGGAVQTGFRYALNANYNIAVQIDGDGQHMASEVRKVLTPVIDGIADMSIGSRYLEKKGFLSSPMRRFGNFIFKVVNSTLTQQKITDNTSGFRAYSREAIKFLTRYYPSDYPEPESVVLLSRNGFRIKEVPVIMQERRAGESSITPIRSVYYMVKVVLAILARFSR